MLTQTIVLLVVAAGFAMWGLWNKYGHVLVWALPLGFGAALGLFALLRLVLDVAATVLSIDGLLWSFGLGPAVPYAVIVRGVTWVLTVELLVGISYLVDWLHGETDGWLRAHVRLIERIGLALRWVVVSVCSAVITILHTAGRWWEEHQAGQLARTAVDVDERKTA